MVNKILDFPPHHQTSSQRTKLIPSRLRDARKLARLSQGELGDLVGVSRQSISFYEKGDKSPEPDTFQRIKDVLQQPVGYFTNPDCSGFGNQGTRFYRKFGADSIRRNEACGVLSEWFVQTARYLDDFVNYPEVDLIEGNASLSSGRYTPDEIETLALDLRKHWGLGLGPISNVLALLESKGIIVCKYEMTGENVEAFSFWNGHRPFIFMASEKTAGVRTRYDLCHELGHLVLHHYIESSEIEDKETLKIIEREANRFSSAFLLPKSSFPNEVYTTKLDAFVPLKERWKISIQAMIYRCKELDIIDDDQYLNLYKQISYRKWRKQEPLDSPHEIPIEQPRLLRRTIELLTDKANKHPEEIVNELRLSPKWIEVFCNLPEGYLQRNTSINGEPTLK